MNWFGVDLGEEDLEKILKSDDLNIRNIFSRMMEEVDLDRYTDLIIKNVKADDLAILIGSEPAKEMIKLYGSVEINIKNHFYYTGGKISIDFNKAVKFSMLAKDGTILLIDGKIVDDNLKKIYKVDKWNIFLSKRLVNFLNYIQDNRTLFTEIQKKSLRYILFYINKLEAIKNKPRAIKLTIAMGILSLLSVGASVPTLISFIQSYSNSKK